MAAPEPMTVSSPSVHAAAKRAGIAPHHFSCLSGPCSVRRRTSIGRLRRSSVPVLVDPKFDETWCRELHIEHNVFDLPRDRLAFFDQLAALSRAPDASFAELRALYESDERLRVPATVFNAVRIRPEVI